MANLKFNGETVRRVPINRNSLFYDAESFAFEKEIGKNYIEQDMGQTVVLYQVNVQETQSDAVYGETDAGAIQFKPPVEIPCVYKIEAPELKSYDKSKQLGTYNKIGKLTFSYYKETIDELGVEIKKGDYVGIQVTPEKMVFWVINNINPNYDNAHTLFGTDVLYLTATCNAVDSSEFKA
jgi:hypothetical protein